MAYIERTKDDKSCVFCRAHTQPDGPDNLILYRGQYAYVILNRYPYTSGHLMVISNAHQPVLEDLDPQTRAEMMELTVAATQALRTAYRPQGFNIGVNMGDAAGAGIADHVHMHIVPRWVGDTNFMSTLGHTRVLPEELAKTYDRLKEAWPLP
jgi:ATP adenylyltransferase